MRELAREAGIIDEEDDPAARPGDLKSDLDAFTGIDACVARRSSVDPLLADVLDAIGYRRAVHDACRILEALKARDPRRCASIAASAVRERCQAWVAVYANDPELCPRSVDLGGGVEGRDPLCLARARRDERLCDAVLGTDRARCRALVRGDPRACDGDASCDREVERWKSLIVAPDRPEGQGGEAAAGPRLHLEVHGVGGTPDPRTTVFDFDTEASAGAVLRRGHDVLGITVGMPRNAAWSSWGTPFASSHAYLDLQVPEGTQPDASLAFSAPSSPIPIEPGATGRDAAGRGATGRGAAVRSATGSGATGASARFDLLLPGVASITTTPTTAGQVRIARLGAEPGTSIELVLDTTVRDADRSFSIHFDLRTYVRDTVALP